MCGVGTVGTTHAIRVAQAALEAQLESDAPAGRAWVVAAIEGKDGVGTQAHFLIR